MNDEYTHSTQSPLEGPKYIKKDMYKIKAKKRQNILLTNTINETKNENQTGKITGQHSPDLGQAPEM